MKNTDTRNEKVSKTTDDPRWKLVQTRDKDSDGKFFYSVRTTGIYCRPSCGARTARPENVDFHLTVEAAEAAGFRPCRRCKPNEPKLSEIYVTKVEQACRLIENSAELPTLAELAKHVDLSTFHFHRIFKSITGLTPKAYGSAHRANTLRKGLDGQMNVTDAIYDAGYGSNSRVYESSNKLLGMKPLDYRKGGNHTEIRFAIGECSLGSILVASSDKGVCCIAIGDDPDLLVKALQDRFPRSNLIGADKEYESLVSNVVGFIEYPKLGLALPLDVQGTVFQQKVWQALREIPCGTTVSYSDLANRIGMPKAVRAVASACAANHIAVAIPCHRVVRNDGTLSGYRWGVERKKALIAKETQL